MDLLRINFPQAISHLTLDASDRATLPTDLVLKPTRAGFVTTTREERDGLKARTSAPATVAVLANRDRQAEDSQAYVLTDNLNPEHLLDELDYISQMILFSDDPQDVESVQERLEQALANLRDLYGDPVAFPEEGDRSKFFRGVAKQLQEINKRNRWWQDLEEAIRECQKVRPSANPVVQGGTLEPLWTKLCRNQKTWPTKAERIVAWKNKRTMIICLQQLPHGGVAIMQQWRRDVDSIVNPMLEGIDDEARREVIEKQRAVFQEMFVVRRHVQGQELPRDELDFYMHPGVTQRLHDVFAESGEDPISTLARISSRLHKETSVTHVQPNHSIRLAWRRCFHPGGLTLPEVDREIWHAWDL